MMLVSIASFGFGLILKCPIFKYKCCSLIVIINSRQCLLAVDTCIDTYGDEGIWAGSTSNLPTVHSTVPMLWTLWTGNVWGVSQEQEILKSLCHAKRTSILLVVWHRLFRIWVFWLYHIYKLHLSGYFFSPMFGAQFRRGFRERVGLGTQKTVKILRSENKHWIAMETWNAHFEASFNPEVIRFCCHSAKKSEYFYPPDFFRISDISIFKQYPW